MSPVYTVNDKEILRDGQHFADAVDETAAHQLWDALVRAQHHDGVRLQREPGAKPVRCGWWTAGVIFSLLIWAVVLTGIGVRQ